MSKTVYTKEDIYEGMVLECVESKVSFWTVGKQYVVNKNLTIKDDDGYTRNATMIANRLQVGSEFGVNFKVVEPEEENGIIQLFNYTFGIKTGDVDEISVGQGDKVIYKYLNFNEKHITIPAYNTQQAIEYLTNELDYDVNDIVSLEVK